MLISGLGLPRALLLVCATTCGCNAFAAVDAEPSPDEIVVVANKQARSLRDVAAYVTVIERAALDKQLAVSASDMFRYTPGVDVEAAGTRFGGEGISIRGIGGNRVAILIDGVPLADQIKVGSFSNATRDFLNAGFTQRVEVLHGPASALYGSSAIGGVVAVSTPDPADIAAAGSSGGNAQLMRHQADSSLHGVGTIALNHNDRGLLLAASYRDGSEEPSAAVPDALDSRDYLRRAALVKFVLDNTGIGTLRFNAIHQDAVVDSDLASFLGSGRYRSTTALLGDDQYRMQLVSAAWEFGDGSGWFDQGILRSYYQEAQTRQLTTDVRSNAMRPVSIERYFDFEQSTRGIEFNLHRGIDTGAIKHRIGAGLEYRLRRSEEFRNGSETGIQDGLSSNVVLGEVFPLRDFPRSETREFGAFIEDSVDIGDLTVIAGVRADRFELRPQDDTMFAENYPFAKPVRVAESDLSPKLALTYHQGERTDLYLQYTEGFRAPPYEDANIGLDVPLFNSRAVPNPDLKSEHSKGLEFGTRWQGERLRLHAAVFRTDYSNFIESRVRIGTDPDSGRILFQARNRDSATIEGLEAGGEWHFSGALRGLSVDGSLYRPRGENRDSGQALNSVGPAQAVLGVNWQQADHARSIRLQATATDAWDRRDESAGELFKPAGHVVLDVYFSQALTERLTLRASVRNLNDKTWWNWSGVRGLAPDDVLLPYLAQPGRTLSVGIQMNW
ncbi:MAG: TonB-dependent receptor [Halioglobus sp.]|nr:TonB-dependent receptor [Halioglobus sp.]